MVISRTPYRISFFGGGTDYPVWYRRHGGAVLATAIDKYCYISCRYLPPFFEHRYRIVYSKTEEVFRLDDIAHPAVREVLKYLRIDRGVEIHHDGDLPARSGLGSSSSFTVGLLHALYALKGSMASKQELAAQGIHVEQEILKETVGSQDQVLAAYGGFNHITFAADGQITNRAVTLAADRIAELNSHLMLFYTGMKRTASDVAQTYVHDLESRSPQLHRLSEMVDEALAILNGGGSIAPFGQLLHEAWLAKRALSLYVSNPYVEELYGEAVAAGAIGGKLLGAGGGGFILFFVPPAHHDKVIDRLRRLLRVPFKFESSGTQVIFYDPEEDYAAEEQLRATPQPGSIQGVTQTGYWRDFAVHPSLDLRRRLPVDTDE